MSCVCVCVYIPACLCRDQKRHLIPGGAVTGGCGLPDVNVGCGTPLVLSKSRAFLSDLHLPSPRTSFLHCQIGNHDTFSLVANGITSYLFTPHIVAKKKCLQALPHVLKGAKCVPFWESSDSVPNSNWRKAWHPFMIYTRL